MRAKQEGSGRGSEDGRIMRASRESQAAGDEEGRGKIMRAKEERPGW
jgi:hypothetical protein